MTDKTVPTLEDLTKAKELGLILDFYIDSDGYACVQPIPPMNCVHLGPINFQLDKKE